MASENASKLLAALAGSVSDDMSPDNRRKLIAGVRSAFDSGDDDELGEALDAYVADFIDSSEDE